MLPNGQWSYVLDLSIYESTANPDGGAIDTNPYGLLVLPDRGVFADAGANALLKIDPNGTISTLAVFPDRIVPFAGGTVPMQAVPTSVTLAPDGNYYVGQLTGFPFPIGGAQVFRVPPQGGTPEVVATGFTNIIDVAVDRNGVGYVLEHDSDGISGPGLTGQLTRVTRDGTRTVISSTLIKPGGVALGPDGAIYVTNRSISAGSGEVLRFAPVPSRSWWSVLVESVLPPNSQSSPRSSGQKEISACFSAACSAFHDGVARGLQPRVTREAADAKDDGDATMGNGCWFER